MTRRSARLPNQAQFTLPPLATADAQPAPTRWRHHGRCLAVAILLAFFAVGAAAQQPANPPRPDAAGILGAEPSIPDEMARIRVALDRIVELLEVQTRDRRAGLAMSRMELEERRAADLERRLEEVQLSRDATDGERTALQQRFRQFVREVEEADGGLDEERRRAIREDLDLRLQRLDRQIADLDRRAAELANRLAARRDAVEGWEATVERLLTE